MVVAQLGKVEQIVDQAGQAATAGDDQRQVLASPTLGQVRLGAQRFGPGQ